MLIKNFPFVGDLDTKDLMHHFFWKCLGIAGRLVWEKAEGKKVTKKLFRDVTDTIREKTGKRRAVTNITLGGNHSETIRILDEALEKDPNFAYYVQRGIAKFKTGNSLGAREDYQRAKEMNSAAFDALLRSGIPGMTEPSVLPGPIH